MAARGDVPAIRVRHTLQPGDLGAVVQLHGSVYGREHGWDHTFEGYVAETVGEFAASYDPARDRLWIAEIDGVPVGMIAIMGHPDGRAQLRWFLVTPDARGHGLGRRLLEDAIAFSRERGYTSIFLYTVKELEPAAALYRRAGFELVEEHVETAWGATLVHQSYELTL